jgi:type I restriction enzyme S subunit
VKWPTPQLQEFCRIIQGGRSGLSGNDFVPKGIPAYGAGGLNGYLPSHEFDEPAVILSSIGARCGKCFYAEGKWASLAKHAAYFPGFHKS